MNASNMLYTCKFKLLLIIKVAYGWVIQKKLSYIIKLKFLYKIMNSKKHNVKLGFDYIDLF